MRGSKIYDTPTKNPHLAGKNVCFICKQNSHTEDRRDAS